MTRWHSPSCQSPLVWVGEDNVPGCKGCGASAHEQLRQLKEHPSNPVPPLPPDEKAGQLNLHWPSSVTYTRKQTTASTGEIHESLQIPNTPSTTQKSLIHGCTLTRDEFRLVCLTAEEKNLPAGVIHLSLETYNDDNFPDYEAVSYTWGGEDGDDTLRHPIYIGEHWDILLQTRNCCAMLRYLRPSRGIRMVWVDAICINQEDMQERGDQVAKMGQIYTGCSQVFLWLGDDIAFRKPGVYPPRLPLHELENLEELQLPNRKKRVSIQSLFDRRYFSRVWVVQELILPPRIVIPIGDKIFWADPSTPTHFERLSNRDWLWEQTRAQWFQHATQGSVMQENLSHLLTVTQKSQSSDIRDKVYGVLGLSSVKEGIKIRPDYGISLQHLVIGSLAHCIISGGTPELLLNASGVSAEADNGAMSLNLTRLVSIGSRPTRDLTANKGWYGIYEKKSLRGIGSYIYVTSQSRLEKVVKAGDDIFLLDTNVRTPIYLILRKTDNHREFRLIAACSHLAFFFTGRYSNYDQDWGRSLPLGDLQQSLHADLTRLHGFFNHNVSGPVDNDYHENIKRALFPGRRGQVTLKEVLPLLLGIARDRHNHKYEYKHENEHKHKRKHKHKHKSWRGFPELYLESIDPKFRPRVLNGRCELSLDADDKEEINNLTDDHPHFWTKVSGNAHRVFMRCDLDVIEFQLTEMVSRSIYPEEWDLVELFGRIMNRLEDEDIGEHIMAGPVEEDHFQGGSQWGLDEVFENFKLDGSTFRVRIV
ncbi:hypothetical protein CEP53_001274 [Fusarium sp. AF-6]|nr:hypothetical protein CEP53_001274 [Fusarium sp. AF-6]